MCQLQDLFRPKYKDYCLSSSRMISLLNRTFPDKQKHIWDGYYYYLSHEDWGKVIRDVLFNMPSWTTDRFDCSNFAILCNSRVSLRYKINTMGIAIGTINYQPHGFNVFISQVDGKPQVFILEPQTGDIYTVDEDSGFRVSYVIFG